MKINQLFKSHIPEEVLTKVLACFSYNNIDDIASFSKADLEKWSTVQKMEGIKEEICKYYLPCKSRLYLEDLNPNKCVTVLRQILRLHGMSLLSKQKYIKQKKCTLYYIKKKEVEERPPQLIKIEKDATMVIKF